jgi:type IV secretion system protein VirD4
VGALVGAFFSQRLSAFRRYLLLAILAGALLFLAASGVAASDPLSQLVGFITGAVVAWFLLRVPANGDDGANLGSARWASVDELIDHGIVASAGQQNQGKNAEQSALFLGMVPGRKGPHRMHYRGDRHLLTIAPNRSGKGTSAIIPNLLTYTGSALVIDPKGENAMMTASRRGRGDGTIPGMQQAVYILDPWNIAQVPGILPACFNPIDWVASNEADAVENAMLLADSLVPQRDTKDPFWDDEARALLSGIILYLAFDPKEQSQRTLGRLRDILVMGDEDLARILAQMMGTSNTVARSTGERTATKEIKLRSSIFATVQSHTHFLDSPVIRESLARSDFRFEDLKAAPTTVYLVLPADRLDAFGRWLRILVQQAITVNARNIAQKPDQPILFMLDEMAALNRLAMVERAFGLMAGFGIQLWGIFQDAAQAKRIYGDGWETFIGNAGVIQYFGSRDNVTAEYFSKLCGVTTIKMFSLTQTIARPFSLVARLFSNGPERELPPPSMTQNTVQRQLAFPDELMRLREPLQLLLIEGCNPVMGRKLPWYRDPLRKHLGRNLHAPATPPGQDVTEALPIPSKGDAADAPLVGSEEPSTAARQVQYIWPNGDYLKELKLRRNEKMRQKQAPKTGRR